ncbi:dr1-associated corepressor [Alosa sapidissima]|uniref:dr1-associated corepressor n=1 Tax=Alosa sapidissima TaxID=34773 RepID=UPI001C092DEC|nr:dr1-associated corepressor [Alosa sapidissima]XP_041928030.1 dr1-associated corepressor [Alosa sapidissima]
MRKQLATPRGKFKMPGKKRRYNVRFPPGRIKKIMQKDTEVGRMAMAVPVVISKVLEMFLRSLLTKANLITQSRHSRTLSVNHVKQCIDSERTFDFLRVLADQAYATSSTKESQEKGSWSQHRRRWQDIPVKAKPSKMEEAPKSKLAIREPLYDDNSSSESELYICLDT